MKKSIVLLASVALLGTGVINVQSQTADAAIVTKAKKSLQKIATSYSNKALTITGKTPVGNRVAINYNGKRVKTAKVNKGHFKANVKFSGYKPFTLYAINAKGKRVTPKVKLAANKYAAKTPVAIKSHRTKKGASYTFATSPKGKLAIYYRGNKILTKKTSPKETKVFISAKALKGKSGHFTVKQLQKDKKASPAAKAEILKVGTASVLNY